MYTWSCACLAHLMDTFALGLDEPARDEVRLEGTLVQGDLTTGGRECQREVRSLREQRLGVQMQRKCSELTLSRTSVVSVMACIIAGERSTRHRDSNSAHE